MNMLSAQEITFKKTENNLGITSQSGHFGYAWGDYDEDGYLDLLISRKDNPHFLYKHEAGQFIDVSTETALDTTPPVIVYVQGVVWGDFDNDSDQDLLIGRNGLAQKLSTNDGDTFVEVGT